MADCLLRQKRFYCREWTFSKLSHCLETRAASKTCGVLVVGGPGCGKTALCCELVWPTASAGKQVALSRRRVAHHFCQSHDPRTLSPANFVASIARQLSESEWLQRDNRRGVLDGDPFCQRHLTADACRADPDSAFVESVLRPLSSLPPPQQNVFVVVDSLDEAYGADGLGGHLAAAAAVSAAAAASASPRIAQDDGVEDDDDDANEFGGRGGAPSAGGDVPSSGCGGLAPSATPSRSIAELLGRWHHLFPHWLMLVCTVRRQRRVLTRWFAGFRKVSLDDLRKAHVVRDVQQYIMYRLDAEESLRRHLRRDTAEMFNQLHIKSNGCILYLEKILDGIADGTLSLREVREIPGTLNGLYLWLCQRLFPLGTFAQVRPIFEAMLASRRPLTVEELFVCVWTRDTALDYDRFCSAAAHEAAAEQLLVAAAAAGSSGVGSDGFASPTLSSAASATAARIFFHDSFAEWLQDVKHCTQKYHCSVEEGHRMLALSYTLGADRLQPDEVSELAYHLSRCATSRRGGCGGSGSGRSLGGSSCSGAGSSTSSVATTSGGGGGWSGGGSSLSGLSPEEQAVWLLYSGAGIDESLLARPSDDPEVNKLLALACVACPEDRLQEAAAAASAYRQSASSALDALIESLHELNEGLNSCCAAEGVGIDADEDDHSRGRGGCGDGGGGAGLSDASRSGAAAALVHSAAEGRRDAVLRLLECGADVSWEDELGQTAVNVAARNGHAEVLSLLLDHGADVNHADGEGWTALRSAAWAGHANVVALLLAASSEVDYSDADQRTALRAAAWGGHGEIASMLLASGANVNCVDKEGRTALTAAAYMGHRDIVQLLLDSGAQVNQCGCDGRSALSVAALRAAAPSQWKHATGVVQLLLERGASVDHRDKEGATALLTAAAEGQRQLCEILLRAGADLDAADSTGRTPLLAAAAAGHVEVVELLMRRGAATDPIDSEGRTALSLAAQHGSVPIVRALLDRGMDEMHRDNRGLTALHLAAFEGHKQVIDLLVDIGARLDEVDNEGSTALLLAAQEGHASIVQLLIDRDADVDRCSHNGRTPLRAAALKGHAEVVKELIAGGANVNYRDADGRSTLYVLALDGRIAMASLLLQHGADVRTADDEGRSALHVACWQGHADMADLLLSAGADVNAVDCEQRTALQSACWQGHADIVDALCRAGAHVNHACSQGATALCVAAQEGHSDVVRVLCQHGADPAYVDKFGRTAAKVATKGGHTEICRIIDEHVSLRSQIGDLCAAVAQLSAVPHAVAGPRAAAAAATVAPADAGTRLSSRARTLSDTPPSSSAVSHGSGVSIDRLGGTDRTDDVAQTRASSHRRASGATDGYGPVDGSSGRVDRQRQRQPLLPQQGEPRFESGGRVPVRQASDDPASLRQAEQPSFVQQLWALRKHPDTRLHAVASEGVLGDAQKCSMSYGASIHSAPQRISGGSSLKARPPLPEPPPDRLSQWQRTEVASVSQQLEAEFDCSSRETRGGSGGRRTFETAEAAEGRWYGSGDGGARAWAGPESDAAGLLLQAQSPRMSRRRNGIRTNPNVISTSRTPGPNGSVESMAVAAGSAPSLHLPASHAAATAGVTGSLPASCRMHEGGDGDMAAWQQQQQQLLLLHGSSSSSSMAGGHGLAYGANGMASGSIFVRPTKTAKIICPQKELSPKAVGVVRPTASGTASRGKETLL